MFTQFFVFALLCAGVCLSVGAYLTVRRPELVERYAMWVGSLDRTGHASFAAVFGILAVIELFDKFWFGALVFGGASGIFAYLAVMAAKKSPMTDVEQAQ